jgi:hypothetical protein
LLAFKVPVDPALFQPCRSHEIGESRTLISFVIEDRRRLPNDFLPRLLAFAHFGTSNQFRDQLVATPTVSDDT